MARFYFDVRDDEKVIFDLEAVKREASIALAEIARDVLPGMVRRVLAIEVRDAAKRPLLEARLAFEIAAAA